MHSMHSMHNVARSAAEAAEAAMDFLISLAPVEHTSTPSEHGLGAGAGENRMGMQGGHWHVQPRHGHAAAAAAAAAADGCTLTARQRSVQRMMELRKAWSSVLLKMRQMRRGACQASPATPTPLPPTAAAIPATCVPCDCLQTRQGRAGGRVGEWVGGVWG